MLLIFTVAIMSGRSYDCKNCESPAGVRWEGPRVEGDRSGGWVKGYWGREGRGQGLRSGHDDNRSWNMAQRGGRA